MAQTLTTTIAINAKVGNGFSEVGNTLTELGSIVDGMSQQLIGFGKESLDVYRDYELSMKDAEVALSTTYGRNSRELAKVMDDLDAYATEWAANTVFHTNDVANAISEAAHAGWDYEKIMTGIPAAMELAQAGSIDLSEAVNYIVKATNAAGIEFDDTSQFIDHWAFAANSSATTIEEMGDAMLKMGQTMQFAGGTDEMLVMLAELANAGTVGSDAGTLLRNSMLRLVAPTQKAEDAMASLGAEADEISEILSDEALAAANAELAAHGFSAYDDSGNLKNMLDIYSELYEALGDIAGGYENIGTNEDANKILAAIFPTRSITGALALLEAAGENYHNLFEYLQDGSAEGYGEYAATTMMDSLYGSMETFESKLERLKQLVGEELSDEVESALSGLGGIVDSISELDEGTLGALVSGAEVLATAGPGLLITGGAFRLIGTILSSKAALIGMGVIGLTTLVKTLHELETVDLKNQFGTGSMDHEAISTYLQEIEADFNSAYTEIDKYKKAIEDSTTAYQTAAETFTADLLTAAITGNELTPDDILRFQQLGHDMRDAVLEGLKADNDATTAYWDMFFGTDALDPEGQNAYDILIGSTNSAYQKAVAEAEGIGEGLRQAMNEAFRDGKISDDEYQNILSYVEDYNRAIAQAQQEAQSREARIEAQMAIHRAEHASLDEIESVSNEIAASRDAAIEKAKNDYYREISEFEIDTQDEIASLQALLENTTDSDVRRGIQTQIATLQSNLDTALDYSNEQFALKMAEAVSPWNDAIYALWHNEIQQSGLQNPYDYLGDLANQAIQGNITPQAALAAFTETAQKNGWNQNQLANVLSRWTQDLGGIDAMEALITGNMELGNTRDAQQYMLALAMQQIAGGLRDWNVTDNDGSVLKFLFGDNWMEDAGPTLAQFENLVNTYTGGETSLSGLKEGTEQLREASSSVDNFFKELETISGYDESQFAAFQTTYAGNLKNSLDAMDIGYQNQLYETISKLSQEYDFSKILEDTAVGMPASIMGDYGDFYAAWQLMFGNINPEDYKIEIPVEPVVDQSTIGDLDPVPLPIEPVFDKDSAAAELQQQGVDVQIDGDTQELQATIAAEDGQNLLTYVDGDAEDLHMSIWDEDGQLLTENVTGNAYDLERIIKSYNGRTITVNIQGKQMFAYGGRATTASIFGEAGPEWAIPEEHSRRTAELLNAAREASGFTWPDLLGMFGGLNSNVNTTPTTIVFSPTINANDATGVEQVLKDSEKRLIRLLEDRKLHDELEVYT